MYVFEADVMNACLLCFVCACCVSETLMEACCEAEGLDDAEMRVCM